jgi:hypothetical protein
MMEFIRAKLHETSWRFGAYASQVLYSAHFAMTEWLFDGKCLLKQPFLLPCPFVLLPQIAP